MCSHWLPSKQFFQLFYFQPALWRPFWQFNEGLGDQGDTGKLHYYSQGSLGKGALCFWLNVGNFEQTQSSLLLLSRQLISIYVDDKKTYCYHMLKKYWVGICVLHLTNQAAGLRFIMSNYSQLSNCSTSIVKVKRWFSCSYFSEMFNFLGYIRNARYQLKCTTQRLRKKCLCVTPACGSSSSSQGWIFLLQIKGELDFQLKTHKNNISELFPTAEAEQ